MSGLSRNTRTLLGTALTAGIHRVQWDGVDDSGTMLGSGMYLCRLETSDTVEATKIVLLR
ncbi:MAG: hypothetical protein KAW17_10575 [Candidatus Eisenbacteria sp.]|nr:hypothetical protein [Candidatus Eisenbacteria bacterium]